MKEESATLLHVYAQPYEVRGDSVKLEFRNRLVAAAGAQLYKEGLTQKLFISGAYSFGEESRPSISEVMSNELIRRGVDSQDIIIRPTTLETSDEIRQFVGEAQEQEWGELSSIATRAHGRRIKLIKSKMKTPIRSLHAESILEKASPHYRHFIKNFHNSQREILFLIREALVILPYYFLPPDKIKNLAKSSYLNKLKSFLDK